MSDEPTYRCDHCGTTWSYRAVRYAARCRDCGSGLTRVAPASAPAPSTASGTMCGLPDVRTSTLPDQRPATPGLALRR